MRKLILDTSVLAYHPTAFYEFDPTEFSDIILPIAILEELDKLKTFPNEVGKNARIAIRKIDELSMMGELHKGIKLPNGQVIRVETKQVSDSYADNRILATALALKGTKKNNVVVSRDINLRIRAKSYGLGSQTYDKEKKDTTELYSGIRTLNVEHIFNQKQEITCADYEELKNLLPNECVHLINENSHYVGRKFGKTIKPLKQNEPWGIKARNLEQSFALDLLMDNRVPLVTLSGLAGSGKSIVCLASAIELVLSMKRFERLIIYRPIQNVGNKELGYMPGDYASKLQPYFEAIYDAFEFLLGGGQKGNKWAQTLAMYQDKKIINFEALSFARGRSIPNSLIIFDEMQSISPDEAKTLLTRVGTGSRVIATGDLAQIDTPHLDAMNNGLTYIIEKLKHSELTGHIALTKGERSPLATLAAEIL